jgi:hypothetical protein
MQLRDVTRDLSFIFVHRLVAGIGRGFKNPQLHLARRRGDMIRSRKYVLRLIGRSDRCTVANKCLCNGRKKTADTFLTNIFRTD